VGVRELHNRTSELLKRVADGEELVVTSHGKRVAKLVPIESADPLAELRARGLVTEPTRKRKLRTSLIVPTDGPPISDYIRDDKR
jgi:prevent-host-death family protein